MTSSVRAMLSARSIAVVGASPRDGSFGHRLVTEVGRSRSSPTIHLVNPRYDEVLGRPCVPSLDAIDGPVDLVLLGVPDSVLEEQLTRAAARGDRSAVVFGTAYEPPATGRPSLTARLATVAGDAGMALCGGGCMGFANVSDGVTSARLSRARPAAGRAGCLGDALGVRVLRAAAHTSTDRLHPGRVVRSGARDDDG